jgi:hypothetical protein
VAPRAAARPLSAPNVDASRWRPKGLASTATRLPIAPRPISPSVLPSRVASGVAATVRAHVTVHGGDPAGDREHEGDRVLGGACALTPGVFIDGDAPGAAGDGSTLSVPAPRSR